MPHVERRSYVRGNFSFKIKFRTMAPDEYEELVRSNEAVSTCSHKETGFDIADKKSCVDTAIDHSLINYLVLIDEKLDLILEHLEKDSENKDVYKHARGMNISGSGMNIVVDRPVEAGQIIHSKFYLSKIPLVFMELFGEVIYATKIENSGNVLYSLGIEFLDISVNDQERIITSVFQRQRGVLRKRKIGAQN